MNATDKEYAFDVTLLAAIRVKAPTAKAARDLLNNTIDAASANLGCWPNGDPILAEVSIDGDADLFEIDGESV